MSNNDAEGTNKPMTQSHWSLVCASLKRMEIHCFGSIWGKMGKVVMENVHAWSKKDNQNLARDGSG